VSKPKKVFSLTGSDVSDRNEAGPLEDTLTHVDEMRNGKNNVLVSFELQHRS